MKKQELTTSVQESLPLPPASVRHPLSEYRIVFLSLLIGTFVLLAIVSILLLISYFFLHNTHVINRILLCVGSLIYLSLAYLAWIRHKRKLASRLLIIFYYVIASIVILGWGVNVPFGLLVFAIGIILTGILLGSRHTLYAAAVAIALLFAIQTVISMNNGTPLFVTSGFSSHYGDVVSYSILLAILALIAWLFGRQTERLLYRNYLAEQELLKEKASLESKVRERTQQLRKAQLEEMEQLYQFAEVGQLSTALLHDLANHLSVLNFDIEDLKKHQHTQTVRNVGESIGYLEQIISQVRKQLRGKDEVSHFNVADCVKDSVKINKSKANAMSVSIVQESPKSDPPVLWGDSLRLSHIINILLRNAIEAYEKNTTSDRVVTVTTEQTPTDIIVRVRDRGSIIPTEKRASLFAPLHSSKKDGLGIGLFIARKIAETHFKGTLTLADTTECTEFILVLPKGKHVSRKPE